MKTQQYRLRILTYFSLLLIFMSACAPSNVTTKLENSFANYDTVKAGKFDTGKMWTFEDAPVDYFDKTYNFKPDEQWLNHVQLSALKFASWCSASFVSADGLVMTNHHCVDFITEKIEKDGEDIKQNGFYAETLDDERKVPDLFVDQLVLIVDVSDEIFEASAKGKTPEEKQKLTEEKIEELTAAYSEDTGLYVRIIPLYSGGKYSLYAYKRYNDVRMVFVAESGVGLYGGDPDNFTYPRYNLDCSFLRVYEDGKPLQTENYFKWSKNGPQKDEVLFVVGNPGRTSRLNTIAQLEYTRDVTLRNRVFIFQELKKIYKKMIDTYPDKSEDFKDNFFMMANSEKALSGQLKGLHDKYLWAKKLDFEKNFKSKIMANPELALKYGHLWDGIENTTIEMRKYAFEDAAYSVNPFMFPKYFSMINRIKDLAENDSSGLTKEELSEKIDDIYGEDFFAEFELEKLIMFSNYLKMNLGVNHSTYKKLFGSRTGREAAKFMMSNSVMRDRAELISELSNGSKIDFNNDPFEQFNIIAAGVKEKSTPKLSELQETQKELNTELGKALYSVYGTSIPPDATFTLRISDGVMKEYNYNGTVAPVYSTFYGLYDRYYSHQKEFPWDLPERWVNPKGDLDLETPIDFISTCDIIGGNSGSPVINKNAEVVGLAFDGNIESLPGFYIFTDESNRTVSVASQGILEAVDAIYLAKRLVSELENGKIIK